MLSEERLPLLLFHLLHAFILVRQISFWRKKRETNSCFVFGVWAFDCISQIKFKATKIFKYVLVRECFGKMWLEISKLFLTIFFLRFVSMQTIRSNVSFADLVCDRRIYDINLLWINILKLLATSALWANTGTNRLQTTLCVRNHISSRKCKKRKIFEKCRRLSFFTRFRCKPFQFPIFQ